jgi:hypothetical protein
LAGPEWLFLFPSILFVNLLLLFLLRARRRVEADASRVLNAEQDKALWNKVANSAPVIAEKETMIDAGYAPPPPRYVKGAYSLLLEEPFCALFPSQSPRVSAC